jgi:hypothetical protein
VHRAVEAHSGVVLVDSLARGTRFTMLLPIAGADQSSRRGETPVSTTIPFEPHSADADDTKLSRLLGVTP